MDWIQQLFSFILHIDDHLVELVSVYGTYIYIILFLIIFIETGLVVAPFLPGDSLLFAAGALAAGGNMNIGFLLFICVLAAILGNQLNYAIGTGFGKAFFEKEKKFIKKEHLEKTKAFYEQHGGKALIIGRYLPLIRTFVPFVAGLSKMDASRFTYYNVLGALMWVIPLAGIGYLFGNIPFVKQNFSIIILIILIISLIPLFWGILSAWRHSKKL